MKADKINPRELQSYHDWVVDHLDEFVKTHPGKVVAVYKGKLVAVGNSYKEVFAAARKRGIKESPFTMEIPYPDDFEAILEQLGFGVCLRGSQQYFVTRSSAAVLRR